MASKWDELLERNRVYAETKHQPKTFMGEGPVAIPSVIIFACLDFRASVEEFLDLKPDEALVIRNLGGRVKSGLHALLFLEEVTKSQALKEVIIIHHTNCGCTVITTADVRESLKSKYPQMADEIDQFDFGTYIGGDLENPGGYKALARIPLVREELKAHVRGYVFDIKTGKLSLVPQ
uniref:Carbonic anhydrase n=1 Tax=Bionectria ochroleuca TaxID=29856 RepID=A0A8H7N674_BIOOC